MFDIQKLIKDIQGSVKGSDITININVMDCACGLDNTPDTPVTDFTVGDRVLICHIKKDGTGTKHTHGTVTDVLQQDDDGWYTRVEGDNGKHYRTGLMIDEERKGSKIVCFVRD